MKTSIPAEMKAAAIDRFGGPDVLSLRSLPVPEPQKNEILIKLDTVGIGVWDPYVREGGLSEDDHPRFPQVIGNDGSGTVVALGEGAKQFRVGDHVYAYTMKGGFYAEYVAVREDDAARVPPAMDADEAGALGADGITALRGLDDQLHLKKGEKVMIFGASGGIGHIAVQLAKRMGAGVLAVASGKDGVELVRRLGADVAVDGHHDDVEAAARRFAPEGLDAALILTGEGLEDERLEKILRVMKPSAPVAYPNGVEPAPEGQGPKMLAYDGTPSREAFDRLNRLIGSAPFHVEIERVYTLEDAARAHRELEKHHLGKMAFRVRPT